MAGSLIKKKTKQHGLAMCLCHNWCQCVPMTCWPCVPDVVLALVLFRLRSNCQPGAHAENTSLCYYLPPCSIKYLQSAGSQDRSSISLKKEPLQGPQGGTDSPAPSAEAGLATSYHPKSYALVGIQEESCVFVCFVWKREENLKCKIGKLPSLHTFCFIISLH